MPRSVILSEKEIRGVVHAVEKFTMKEGDKVYTVAISRPGVIGQLGTGAQVRWPIASHVINTLGVILSNFPAGSKITVEASSLTSSSKEKTKSGKKSKAKRKRSRNTGKPKRNTSKGAAKKAKNST